MKNYIVIILGFCLMTPLFAKERIKPIPMSELKNISSPSFVPVPYPKTREEIIQNVLFATKKLFVPSDVNMMVGTQSPFAKIVLNLLEKKPVYKIGKIYKVKNRNNRRAHDFVWHILFEDLKGNNVAVLVMDAQGLLRSGVSFPAKNEKTLLYTSPDVLKKLGNSIGSSIDEKKVKHCERIVLADSLIGDELFPTWEIEFVDGSTYYYSTQNDEMYQVTGRIARRFKQNGQYESERKYLPVDTEDYAFDSISDQVVLLKRLKKIK